MHIPIDHIFFIALGCLCIGMVIGMIIGHHWKETGEYKESYDLDIDEHAEWWDGTNYREEKPDMLKKQAD